MRVLNNLILKKYNFLLQSPAEPQKYEQNSSIINNKSIFNGRPNNFDRKNYKDKNYNHINLANNIINDKGSVRVINNNIFIKDYFYYKVVFAQIEPNVWVALRITENINRYGYSKIYKAVLFEKSYLNDSFKWIQINELKWIDLCDYINENPYENKFKLRNITNTVKPFFPNLLNIIECFKNLIEGYENIFNPNDFELASLNAKFIYIDKLKNILFPATINMSTRNLFIDKEHRGKNKYGPIIRIFIENINGNFKLNLDKVYYIKNSLEKLNIKEELNLKLELNDVILPNKIFFLKELQPFINYEINNNNIYIDHYNTKEYTIEKDNLFKDTHLKYLYYKKYFEVYTQGAFYRVSSTFCCLNLINNWDCLLETETGERIVFIRINHKTGLIDNSFEIPQEFIISLFKDGNKKEKIFYIIQNIFVDFIKTGKISNLNSYREFKRLKTLSPTDPTNLALQEKNKQDLDLIMLHQYYKALNNLNTENLNFYATIKNNNISNSLVDDFSYYIKSNFLDDSIFISISSKNNSDLKIKLPNLLLDFKHVLKTSVTQNWDLKTTITNFNKLSEARKNKIFKYAFYHQFNFKKKK